MSKIYGQQPNPILTWNASLAAGASISGSGISAGFAYLTGLFRANASTGIGAASGLVIQQSGCYGQDWDIISGSYQSTASVGSGFSIPIYGNAIKVTFWNGGTATCPDAYFALRAI